MAENTKTYLQIFLTFIIAGCAVYGTFFGDRLESNQIKILIYLFYILVFMSVCVLAWILNKKLDRRLKYADNFSKVITATSVFVNGYSEERKSFLYNLSKLLSKMSVIYKDLKGVDCSFAVKILDIESGEMQTLERVSKDEEKRKNRETFIKNYDSYEKFIEDNTDLNVIFGTNVDPDTEGKNIFFFNNDLTKDFNYKHSLLRETDYYNKIKNNRNFVKKHWPLPFRSTIVIPLCLMEKSPSDPDFAFLGTLCIDTYKTDIFKEEIDVKILQSLAETIYLTFLSDQKKNGNNKT